MSLKILNFTNKNVKTFYYSVYVAQWLGWKMIKSFSELAVHGLTWLKCLMKQILKREKWFGIIANV